MEKIYILQINNNKIKKISFTIMYRKKIVKMFLFLTVWLNFCSNIFMIHPVYVSMTNMNIDAQKGGMELCVRIFADDLETVLHNKYNVHGWIGSSGEHQDVRRLLNEYVNERFSVVVNNNEKIDLITDSIVIVEDMLWFYMMGVAKQTIRHVEIVNRLLTDFFSTQSNLMIISTGRDEKEKGHKLDRKNYKVELSL